MRKTVRKFFWMWDFDKEERWLNEMAAKGLCLISVGWCRYEFEECLPGAYSIRLELLEHDTTHPESVKYVEFLEDTGAEHVGSYMRWIYMRKKKADGAFQLFSDHESRIRHLTRIMRFICLFIAINLYCGLYNLYLYVLWGSAVSLLGVVNLLMCAVFCFAVMGLWRKRQRLKEEQRIFE